MLKILLESSFNTRAAAELDQLFLKAIDVVGSPAMLLEPITFDISRPSPFFLWNKLWQIHVKASSSYD
jgi:hypothetical protein